MHDPSTVAFEIRLPWYRVIKFGNGASYRRWAKLATVWHVDPEKDAHKRGCRSDDSCGWGTVPTTPEQREKIRKLGEDQYRTLFGKQHHTAQGDSFAYVCFEPTAYDAVYWAWRAIKRDHHRFRRPVWQYGRERRYLNAAELEYIYSLSSSPIDNLRVTVSGVRSAEDCGDFFLTVYRCFLRFNRPWYRHPRWHFWHWSFQIHAWQTFRRWAFSRCAHCGKRFSWGYSPVAYSWDRERPKWFRSESGVYHSECSHIATDMHRAAVAKTEGAIH